MNKSRTILQIVPSTPGQHDGVGDYALTLAQKLRQNHAIETIFAANELRGSGLTEFEVRPLSSLTGSLPEFSHIVLHYVGYGYQNRGVPFALPGLVMQLKGNFDRALLTVFHELYASAPPWRSAFWLRPFQIRITQRIAKLSDAAVVSSETTRDELHRIAHDVPIHVHPVISNFGEPALAPEQLSRRDPQRWIICGGTALVEKSLRTFLAVKSRIAAAFAPRELMIIGGADNPIVRDMIATVPYLSIGYQPKVDAATASDLLSKASFAWLDYFHRPDAPMGAILKSTAFAAACAHGVVPVFPHGGAVVSLDGDPLPGPYYIEGGECQLPSIEELPANATRFFEWYGRHASSDTLAQGIAAALPA